MENIDFDSRNDWDFKDMKVDQVMPIHENKKEAQKYAHTYGGLTGKRFATRTVDGVLYVKRVA